MQETLSVKEAATILRVSENAVRRGIKSGEWNIPHIMNGNRIVILRERFFREFLCVPDDEMERRAAVERYKSEYTGVSV